MCVCVWVEASRFGSGRTAKYWKSVSHDTACDSTRFGREFRAIEISFKPKCRPQSAYCHFIVVTPHSHSVCALCHWSPSTFPVIRVDQKSAREQKQNHKLRFWFPFDNCMARYRRQMKRRRREKWRNVIYSNVEWEPDTQDQIKCEPSENVR